MFVCSDHSCPWPSCPIRGGCLALDGVPPCRQRPFVSIKETAGRMTLQELRQFGPRRRPRRVW